MKTLFVTVLLFSLFANADVTCPGGVTYESELDVEMNNGSVRTVFLNGVGKKRVLFFDVFYAGLYLERPSNNAVSIINSSQIKVGLIHTLRKIGRKRLVDLWDDEYERLCGDQCEELRPFHNKFLSYARDVKKGERLYLISFPDRFEFEVNGNEFYDPIWSPEYAKILQRVLIGPDAEDKNLEKALLGKTRICQ